MFGILAVILPNELPVSKNEKMDWIGSVLGISAFTIFNFVWKYVVAAVLPIPNAT